jgi:hypothetical protein
MLFKKWTNHLFFVLLRPAPVQSLRHSTFNTVPTTSFHHIFVSPQLSNIMASGSFPGPQLNTPGQVDSMTHTAGMKLASQVQLRPEGLSRIENALANLPRSPLFVSSDVCMGFGEQSYIRTLAATQYGKTLVALCGCLTAVHSESMTARI